MKYHKPLPIRSTKIIIAIIVGLNLLDPIIIGSGSRVFVVLGTSKLSISSVGISS